MGILNSARMRDFIKEVRQRYDAGWNVALLERRDILAQEPRFAAAGVTALCTALYGIARKAA